MSVLGWFWESLSLPLSVCVRFFLSARGGSPQKRDLVHHPHTHSPQNATNPSSMSASAAFVRELVTDVLYGSTKEMLRVLLAASFTTLMVSLSQQRPKGHAGRWVAGAKLCGAVALFLLCIYVAIEGMARRCDEDQPLCGFLPWMRAPLPPPPPPLKQLELVTKDKTLRALRYCKAHPFEVAAAVGSVFLFDLFNVAVTVDRLDPVVRLAGFIGRPISRIARWVWRLAAERRAQTLVAAVGIAAS